CTLRVGSETRTWRKGKCLVFDDSFEHEATNPSERARVVLLVDVWHPDLTAAQRRRLASMYRGTRAPKDVGLRSLREADGASKVVGAARAFATSGIALGRSGSS